MSWRYTPETSLSSDKSWFVPSYPRYVARAFLAVSYDEQDGQNEKELWKPYHEQVREAMESFAQRWGGLSDAVFLRVLQEGVGLDRLVALFAIGSSDLSQASEVLTPFLQSADLLERRAAACLLAIRQDERALPVLKEYLLHEPIDEQGRYLLGADPWYLTYRHHIVRLVATWGPPSFVVVLRQLFIQLWAKEQEYAFPPDYYTNDALFYALGRRGALGAMHGMALPEPHRRLAMLFIALGYVHAYERFEDIEKEIQENQALKEEVSQVFVEHFALSKEESWKYISSFGLDYEERMNVMYGE